MDDNNKDDERTLKEERIRERDKCTPSPEERAGYIFNLIKDHNNAITNWDLLCFCVEYLASQVLVYDWLNEDVIRFLNQRVYFAHYMRNEIAETGIK